MIRKTAYRGVLIGLAFVFSYLEFLIPVNIGIPGAKLGLANLVVLTALYTLGAGQAIFLSVIRILLAGFTFGTPAAMLYSLGGGILSLAVMIPGKRTGWFSMTGVSVLGGISHNIGQILVAIWMLGTKSLFYYLPILVIAGVVSGGFIGITGAMITKRIKKAVPVIH